eukprot:TRINITY_DN2296_c0_g1_i2.p1 TRINITY_DN2296_c0_g1~~TRINITY_DN2296_c0_g1_i2.p1  ORF type:complete len:440 (+),score=103.95 TRINITY_DN2296_c0_g1_i2:283-1602(+)
MERFAASETLNIPSEFTKAADNKRKSHQPASKCVVHTFEEKKSDHSFAFEKAEVAGATTTAPRSELSEALKSTTIRPSKSQQGDSAGTALITITVWFPTKESVKLTIGDKTLVEEVIHLSIQQYILECSDKKKQMRINSNPKAYVTRFAEDDGVPDEDMPALGRTQEIGGFKGCTSFALCIDTSFKTLRANSSRSTRALEVAPVPLFKVFLPNEEGFVSVTLHVETTLKQVLEAVCKKRALSPDSYGFEFYDPPPKGSASLALHQTLGELGLTRLRLVEKSKSAKEKSDIRRMRKSASIGAAKDLELGGDAPKPITKRLGPMYLTPQTAAAYQEFAVIKFNKFGIKQDRTMGIDDKYIVNSIPDAKVSKNNDKVKRPQRPTSEIQKVWMNSNKPSEFYIKYRDQTYRYESKDSEEIVAKLGYLLKVRDEGKQRSVTMFD